MNTNQESQPVRNYLQSLVRWVSIVSCEFIGVSLILCSGMEMKDQLNGDSEYGFVIVAITGTLGFIITRSPSKYFK